MPCHCTNHGIERRWNELPESVRELFDKDEHVHRWAEAYILGEVGSVHEAMGRMIVNLVREKLNQGSHHD